VKYIPKLYHFQAFKVIKQNPRLLSLSAKAKALMELAPLRQVVYVGDLIHAMFEQHAIKHIDDISDEKIRAVFKQAAELS